MSLFSAQELYKIRNEIPINQVITRLGLPSKIRDGFFRFLCPQCSEFHTATNPSTNLARCFGCQRSFNPIDITMAASSCSFKEAIEFLTKAHGLIRGSPPHHGP